MVAQDLQLVWELFAKKRRVVALLRNSHGLVRPGAWKIEGAYARHRATDLTPGLSDAVWGIRRRRGIRELVERGLPPWFTWARAAPTSVSEATIGYLTNGGSWKLFDQRAGLVLSRRLGPPPASDGDLVARFSAVFSIPRPQPFRHDGADWTKEKYLGDRSLAVCTTQQRIGALHALFDQFLRWGRGAAIAPRPDLTRSALDTLAQHAAGTFPADAIALVAPQVDALGTHLPLAPAHADLSGQNVFLCDGEPWVIDWDTAGSVQPIDYDLCYLILREAELGRPDLLQACLAGAFDAQLDAMIAQGGASNRAISPLALLLHGYAMRFHRMRSAGARDVAKANVEATWQPLRAFCEPGLDRSASAR